MINQLSFSLLNGYNIHFLYFFVTVLLPKYLNEWHNLVFEYDEYK